MPKRLAHQPPPSGHVKDVNRVHGHMVSIGMIQRSEEKEKCDS